MQVRFQHITKSFGSFVAVDRLNLEIESGAFHFLLGASGSGKSTTIRMVAGLEPPTEGKIFFNQKDVTHQSAIERGIGMVFQNYALWPHMTVYENIAYPLRIAGLPQAMIREKVEEVLSITHMTPYKKRFPSELSGGQQQRVAVARALVGEPSVLLLDEPLSNLDGKLRNEIRDHLIHIHKKLGITMIYVTHDRQEALSMGTAITVMQAGREIQTASPRNLYLNPANQFLAQFMGDCNLATGQVKEIHKDGSLSVITDLGQIRASNLARTFQEGEKVILSIRPESIKIDLGRQELKRDINIIHAQLTRTTYLGEVEKLLLKTEKGKFISVSLFNAPDYNVPINESIKCFFKASKVRVLPLETTSSYAS